MHLIQYTQCLCWGIARVREQRNLNYIAKRSCFYIKTSAITPPCKPKTAITPPCKPKTAITPPCKPKTAITPPCKPKIRYVTLWQFFDVGFCNFKKHSKCEV